MRRRDRREGWVEREEEKGGQGSYRVGGRTRLKGRERREGKGRTES